MLQWEPVKEQYPFDSGYDCHVNLPNGLENYLETNGAVNHKDCYSKLNSQKLAQAKKRQSSDNVTVPAKIQSTRSKCQPSASEAGTSNSETRQVLYSNVSFVICLL